MRVCTGIRPFVEIAKMIGHLSLAIAVVAIALKTLDVVPSMLTNLRANIDERAVASRFLRFDSLEDAETKMGIRIPIPNYFPDLLVWPPSAIYAQREPPVLTVVFRAADLQEGLIVRQSLARGNEPNPLLAEPFVVIRRSAIGINGQAARLVEGENSDGAARNQLQWHFGNAELALETSLPVPELKRIAESIHADE